MIRDLAPFLIVNAVIGGVMGGLYGAGWIGVPAVYGLILLAGIINAVALARWDERHHA